MLSKFDKISFVISLIVFLTVAVGILWMDAGSVMWTIDFIVLGITTLLFVMPIGAYLLGAILKKGLRQL